MRLVFLNIYLLFFSCIFSQNELDAIRYSRGGLNGSSRFISMGGAFGSIGADLSCGAFNPAGLGLYRKGDLAFSFGINNNRNEATLNQTLTSTYQANLNINFFGIAYAVKSKSDQESRHVLAYTSTQLQNFNNSTIMSGYTNSNSIAKDMLNLAQQQNNITNLNYSYEGLAFETLLFDTVNNQFISLLDNKRSVKQTREINTEGFQKEINLSYAYSLKDKLYFGLSIGIPEIEYTSTTTHTESDDKDSMRIGFITPTTYTTSYVDGLPILNSYYFDYLGFNSLNYTEYFKTTGSGLNLKIGTIARLNEFIRIGFYYHTSTTYYLTDEYYNKMSVSFDGQPKDPIEYKNPENGGYYKYQLTTPSKFSLSTAILLKKLAVIGLEYEQVKYTNAKLISDPEGGFNTANNKLKNNYSAGHNFRIGSELNIKPIFIRTGYSLQGSPNGLSLSGNLVRHSFNVGIGFRAKNNLYFDLTWNRKTTSEDYFLFKTLASKSLIKLNSTSISITIGFKF